MVAKIQLIPKQMHTDLLEYLKRLTEGVAFFGMYLTCFVQFSFGENIASTFTADALIDGVNNRFQSVGSLSLTYEIHYVGEDIDESSEGLKNVYLHRTVIVNKGGTFFQETSHGSTAVPHNFDLLLERYYFDGSTVSRFQPVHRLLWKAKIGPDKTAPSVLGNEFFFVATGYWPFFDISAPRLRDQPYFFADIERDPKLYSVRKELESRDGHWCHVLERPGVDAMWIDHSRNYALMERENRDPKTGALMQRLILSSYREITPGLYLPETIENMQYDYNSRTETDQGRLVIHSKFKLIRACNDSVPDDDVKFTPPSGTAYLHDDSGKIQQIESGGTEVIRDIAIATLHRYPELNQADWQSPIVYAAVGSLAGIVLAMSVRSRMSSN
jgi:hypothetical protein